MVDSVALFSRTSAMGGTQTRATSSSTGQLRSAGSRTQCRTGTSDAKEYSCAGTAGCCAGYCWPEFGKEPPPIDCRPSAHVTESAARQDQPSSAAASPPWLMVYMRQLRTLILN